MVSSFRYRGDMMAIVAFLVLTFGYSWGVFLFAVHRGLFHNGVGIAEFPYLVAYMAGPAIAALIVGAATRRSAPFFAVLGLRFRPNGWWLLAWVLPIVLCFGAVTLSSFTGISLNDPEAAGRAILKSAQHFGGRTPAPINGALLFYALLAAAATLGALINMFGTLTEELGWRGYLWSKLRPIGFWPTNLIVGTIWGIWHAPVIYAGFNYPGAGWYGVAMMTLFCVLLAPSVGLVRELGRSVLAAGLFHGTLNAVAGVSLFLLATHPVFWNGIVGWMGMALMLAADISILAFYRPRPLEFSLGSGGHTT
jgi:membrane protease YdiL (CAAX protease family)